MATTECIVKRATGYTVMSNHHLRDKNLKLGTKGLLTVILSLPEDWDYTIAGLAVVCGVGKDAIRAAVNELETAGYITRKQVKAEGGKFGGNQYIIREIPEVVSAPLSGFPTTEKPATEKPLTENPTEIITDQVITDEPITPKSPETAGAENTGDGKPGKRPRKNKDKPKADSKPKDLLDDEQLKTVLESQVKALGNEFQMDRTQKNRLYQIALHWYAPRTLASAKAAPPVHTELGISNLFRKVARGARVIGIDAAIEVFYDALSRGHTDIHDERFKVGYQPGGGKAAAASVRAEGLGESW